MLELRLLLVGLFYRFRALLLGFRSFRRRAVRGVALRDGSGCVTRRLSARAVCGDVRRRGVFVCQRAGGLRRRAPCVLRTAASARPRFAAVLPGSERGRITRSARPPPPNKRPPKGARRCEIYQNGCHVSVVRLSPAAFVF